MITCENSSTNSRFPTSSNWFLYCVSEHKLNPPPKKTLFFCLFFSPHIVYPKCKLLVQVVRPFREGPRLLSPAVALESWETLLTAHLPSVLPLHAHRLAFDPSQIIPQHTSLPPPCCSSQALLCGQRWHWDWAALMSS